MSVMNQFKICLLGQDNEEEMEPNVAQATKKVNGKHALSDTKTNKLENQDEDALYEGFHKCLTFDQCLAEMQKAASMASVLVLIFPPAVLIFEHPAQIVIN